MKKTSLSVLSVSEEMATNSVKPMYFFAGFYRHTPGARKFMQPLTMWSKLNMPSKTRPTSVLLCPQLYWKSTVLSSRVCSQSGVPLGQSLHQREVPGPLHQQLWLQCKMQRR